MVDGYVTQTRKRYNPNNVSMAGSLPKKETLVYNGNIITGTETDLRSVQTTTSFRSNLPERTSFDRGIDQLVTLMGDFSLGSHQSDYDTGHSFRTEQTSYEVSHPRYTYLRGSGSTLKGFVNGTLVPDGSLVLPPDPGFDLNWYANKAISSCAPTVPNVAVAETLAELFREGITLPWESWEKDLRYGVNLSKSAGSGYLNLSFGWVPLLSDLVKLMNTVANASKLISALDRDSGLMVRRKWRAPIQPVSTNLFPDTQMGVNVGTNGSNISGGAWSDIYENGQQTGSTTTATTSHQEVWFSGAFTYYINPGKDLVGRFERYGQLASALTGPRVTPAAVWELAPWSWLTDYFLDVGSALKTADLLRNDSLVMKYGYMMRRFQTTVTRTSTVRFKGQSPIDVSITKQKLVKERYKATPFGFGLNPAGFTDRQWAILGALGLSKGPKSLF
uniref:Uncharacterized protein n=1 Tax=Leviviridae sp. TaxID=2027243 RepID=A0A514D7D5_9VIRU|nr:MAG: hypothetical protein H4Bulk461134_000001 [Leviviridae sp.]